MYKKFYGLKDNPFKLSPSLEYFFLYPRIEGTIEVLRYGIDQGVGFMLLIGEVGVGKTSLLKYFLDTLDSNIKRVYVVNPSFRTPEELIGSLLVGLGVIKSSKLSSENKVSLLEKLNEYLKKQYNEGKKVLFILDDAQTLSDFMLEELRLLSNLETEEDKLIQIFLTGQPELKQRVKSKKFRQLAQRIAINVEMEPLTLKETADYIQFRLIKSGASGNLFDRKAIKLIHKKSLGLPRVINLIAERALIAGYVHFKKVISKKEVKVALKDLEL